MTAMTTLTDLMVDDLVHNVDGLLQVRLHRHRPAAGISTERMPLLAVYPRSVTTRFDTTEPESRATATWHLDYYVGDVLGVEAAAGNDTAAAAIDVVEAMSRHAVGWGDGIPDGQGGVVEEYADPRRIDIQEDGATLRCRLIVEVSTLAWVAA